MELKSICLGLAALLVSSVAMAKNEGPRSFQCTPQVVMVLGTYTKRAQVENNTSLQLGLRAIEEKFSTILDLERALEIGGQADPNTLDPVDALSKSVARTERAKIRAFIMDEGMKLKPCLDELVRIRQLQLK